VDCCSLFANLLYNAKFGENSQITAKFNSESCSSSYSLLKFLIKDDSLAIDLNSGYGFVDFLCLSTLLVMDLIFCVYRHFNSASFVFSKTHFNQRGEIPLEMREQSFRYTGRLFIKL
jgi:hypothetical protein